VLEEIFRRYTMGDTPLMGINGFMKFLKEFQLFK